ncbi:MAG: hypothetical protein WC702_01795 [Patescibacteria group bacterium]|jgi:hypothetical protein
MLVFLRALPILAGLTMAIGSMALFWFPGHPFIVIGVALLILFFILAKLAGWSFNKADFWSFFALPFCLAVSAFSLLLFVEGRDMKILIITLATLLLWLFAENIFSFLYLSSTYQVNALEYLSLVMGVVSVFFVTAAFFALRLFFGFSLWLIVPLHAVFIFALFASVLWVCKIGKEKIIPNAFGAVLLLAELFLCLAFLPASFFSNAAILTLFFYIFLGIVRAHLFNRLSPMVLKRYLLAFGLIAVVIVLTAKWT